MMDFHFFRCNIIYGNMMELKLVGKLLGYGRVNTEFF